MDFQRWLDEWADCVLAQDFDCFRAKAVMPFEMVTPEKRWTVREDAVLEAAFHQYARFLAEHGATTIARSLKRVTQEAEDKVILDYSNHIMRGAQRIIAPSHSRTWLRQEAADWRCYRVEE